MAYAQPAAANYYTTPSHPTPKQRGFRLCDQCGAVEQPNLRFRLCGGCVSVILRMGKHALADGTFDIQMVTQYCVSLRREYQHRSRP